MTTMTPVEMPSQLMGTSKKVSLPRVAFYSHDTQGLGHIRRNLAIATALQGCAVPPVTLLISGTQLGMALGKPAGVDFLTLPAVAKDASGCYYARSLALSLDEIIKLRAATIQSTLAAFAPDVLIVDKTPTGLKDELLPALQTLRRNGRTRCVLGLRDVLDDPVTTRREWDAADSSASINRFYDTIWIYGDPSVYDPLQEYNLAAELAPKVRYTGYLDRSSLASGLENHPPLPILARLATKRLALCMVGGGEDGGQLAQAFALADLPADTTGIIVTGPYMPPATRKKLHRIASSRPRLKIIEFMPDPLALLQAADAVVTMGGYNTVCEILAHNKRALIVPRVKPRLEQFIRAARLQELGLVDVLHPGNLTPKHLSEWLASANTRPDKPRMPIDLCGFDRLPHLFNELLAAKPR